MVVMKLAIDTKVRLNNGVEMPLFGFGTYRATGDEARRSCLWALEAGYRLIDTASLYDNEREVGRAVRESGIPRSDIFVTTKLWNSDHGLERAVSAFDKSLARLGIDYVDLFLIHWPVGGRRGESWRALEKILESGKCLAIGVSNYMIRHLVEVLAMGSTTPAVNQVEFSPYLHQKNLLEFCRSKGIQFEAYGSLTRRRKFTDRGLAALSGKYGKSPAQILIRWALQKSVVVIPKSVNRERIQENADVFDFAISAEDVKTLDAFDEGFRTSWNPADVE